MEPSVIVGVDGSDEALRAVTWAAREAVRRRLPLRVVNVLPKWAASSPPGSRHPEVSQWWRHEARRIVRQAVAHAERDFLDVPVQSAVIPGDPVPVLINEATSGALLVVGGHGLGELRGLLVGSVGLKLAGHTPCPLVIARGADPADGDEIVVGVDGSPESAAALDFAFGQAVLWNSRVRALHAWQPPLPPVSLGAAIPAIDMTTYAHDAERILANALEPARRRYPDVKVDAEAVCGHPVRVLEEATGRAGLLVVGARGLGGLSGLVLGSVSHGVLHRARCPVAILRGEVR